MANLRDIRRRIGSVKNTRQITRAMKMVSGAKLRRATDRAVAARPYQETLGRVLQRVAATAGPDLSHELLRRHEEVRTVAYVVFSTDRGLCGGFNNNLFRKLDREIARQREEGREIVLHLLGRKAVQHYGKREQAVASQRTGVTPSDVLEAVRELADRLQASFVGGEVQQVVLAYNVFRSAGSQVPSLVPLLPLTLEAGDPAEAGGEYTFEPDGRRILDTLLPMFLQTRLQQCFLETEAGEHAARMQAMDNATRNAEELIDTLTLSYNRARQAAITTEIIEIVSGAEAL